MPQANKVAKRAIRKAKKLGASPRELKALVAAGIVESGLQHDKYLRQGSGDRDSVGFLQQRPSQGWGESKSVSAGGVEQDTADFLRKAMELNRSGFKGSAGQLAQAVQRSAFPGRYDERGREAEQIIRQVSGRDVPSGDTGPTRRTRQVQTVTPGVDRSEERQSLLQSYLASERGRPGALLALKAGLDVSQDTPAQIGSRTVTEGGTRTARPSQGGAGGARSAVSYARSKVGEAEQGGANRGPLPGWLNQRFGFEGGGQPWCAMFTSVAVTKGGAPKTARTASVAEVRAKAKSKQGYRGFVNPRKARAGDLILFGNDHIGMVEKVTSKGIVMIAGNDANKVNRRTVGFGSGDVVRPAYKR